LATLPVAAGTRPNLTLPAPLSTWETSVNMAPAHGWTRGTATRSAPGASVKPQRPERVARDVGNVVWRVSSRP
jgi:hypothetical protein